MPEPDDSGGGESTVERWIRLVTGVLAPTTVLTALLLYFGYVAATAEYAKFGLTLGTLGLSTQELVLRSAAALYLPLGAVLLAVVAASWLHRRTGRLVASGSWLPHLRWSAVALVAVGTVGIIRGVLGVVVPEVSRTEPVAMSPASFFAFHQ